MLPEVVIVVLLILWNLLANLAAPQAASIPLNLAAVTALLVVARRSGAGWGTIGVDPTAMLRSARVGVIAALSVLALIATVVAIPPSRELFADDRFLGESPTAMLYEVLLRIPLATALAEELAFRGVVLGMLLLWVSPLRAVVLSSILFGLWHVLPAFDSLETNPAADVVSGPLATFGEVSVQVAVTALAGIGFAWLRLRDNHIAAPALTHWALNGSAYAAGWLVVRHGWA